MPVYVLVDGMGPSDRSSFIVGDTQPSDLLRTTSSATVEEHITRTEDGRVQIVEDI